MFVFDCNQIEDYDITNNEELNMLIEEIRSFPTLRDATETLLSEFFEVDTIYGDPIATLLDYVPENRYEEILNDYHYMIADNKKELIAKIKNGDAYLYL